MSNLYQPKINYINMLRKTILLTLTVISILTLNSCKNCEVSHDDTNTGEIVNDVIIYANGSTMTANYHTQLFDGVNTPADIFQVSYDGGLTKVNVDWNSHYILSMPMTVKCDTEYKRNVSTDALNGIVRYTVDAITCSKCEEHRTVENLVLVNKFPISYSVFYTPTVKEI